MILSQQGSPPIFSDTPHDKGGHFHEKARIHSVRGGYGAVTDGLRGQGGYRLCGTDRHRKGDRVGRHIRYAGAVVVVESGCTWTLTGDCTVTSLTNNGTINFNGYTITLADGTALQ